MESTVTVSEHCIKTPFTALIAVSLTQTVLAETHDLGSGTFKASGDFVFKREGTKDSFMGTLTRKSDGFTIIFDVGLMAGAPGVGYLGSWYFHKPLGAAAHVQEIATRSRATHVDIQEAPARIEEIDIYLGETPVHIGKIAIDIQETPPRRQEIPSPTRETTFSIPSRAR